MGLNIGKLAILPKGKLFGLICAVYLLTMAVFAAQPLKAQSPPIRVNAGGGAYTDSQGQEWEADNYFNTGQIGTPSSQSISGTDDDPLYQTERWDATTAPPLEYTFNLPDGDYQVKLHFAETHPWGGPWRFFDVNVQGQTVLTEFNIYNEVGNNAALVKDFPATVTNGQLKVGFAHGSGNNPKISAIEILPQLPVEQVSGTLTESQTWTNDRVWYITNTVEVPNGITLNIEEGTIVKIAQNVSGFNVQQGGILSANGSVGEQVAFTSYKDDSAGGDSNGDGPSTGAPGDYYTAINSGSGVVSLDYATLRFGDRAFNVSDTSITVQRSIIEDSSTAQCFIASTMTFTDNIFKGKLGLNTPDPCEGDITLQRNEFDVIDDYPISATGIDAASIQLTGANRNTFVGSNQSVALKMNSTKIPAGSTWVADESSGIEVIYLSPSSNQSGISVSGTFNLEPGITVKTEGSYRTGIRVEQGGSLNALGADNNPIAFTSYKDDNVGGDSNGDGSSQGGLNDFGNAVSVRGGGEATLEYANMTHGRSAFDSNSGDITISHSAIEASENNGIFCSTGGEGSSNAVLADNTFKGQPYISNCTENEVTLHRNHFEVSDDYPIELRSSDATIIQLTGPNKNTFTGDDQSAALYLHSARVPSGSTWNVSMNSGVRAIQVDRPVFGNTPGISVEGTLNLEAGSVLKATVATGIRVEEGGTLNSYGTSNNPAIFTSYKDDGVGGDSTGEGPSEGGSSDYGHAIVSSGGHVLLEHAIIRHGGTGVSLRGSATVTNSLIENTSSDISCSSAESTDVAFLDNEFKGQLRLNICTEDAVTLHRNNFEAINAHPIEAWGSDATIIQLTGPNRNTFTGNDQGAALYLNSVRIPAESTWTVDNDSGVKALLIDRPVFGNTPSILVEGTLNLEAGSIVKAILAVGVRVEENGVLNANGTSNDPVIFTSDQDDSAGGDSDGNGPSAGEFDDYNHAIWSPAGGDITLEHTNLRYADTAIAIGGESEAEISGALISDVVRGIGVSNDAFVSYRGSFSNIGDRAITSCNWDSEVENCFVDAAHVNWGSEDGPVDEGLVCGAVWINPWIYNGVEHNESWTIPDCGGSDPEFSSNLLSSGNNFDDMIEDLGIECDQGIQESCDLITTRWSCINGLIQSISGQSAFPLPDEGDLTEEGVYAYASMVLGAAGSYIGQFVSPGLGNAIAIYGYVNQGITLVNVFYTGINDCSVQE